jgi:hypothetical protein
MAAPTAVCENSTWMVAIKPTTQPLPMPGSNQVGYRPIMSMRGTDASSETKQATPAFFYTL